MPLWLSQFLEILGLIALAAGLLGLSYAMRPRQRVAVTGQGPESRSLLAGNQLECLRERILELERVAAERADEAADALRRLHEEQDSRRQTENQLFYYSLHDALTGLPNRSLFLNRLDLAVARRRRDARAGFAVLFLDFDDFKRVNETHGSAAGDAFLREAAARLLHCVRKVDTVARLGGDEFVILLDEATSSEEARDIAERIAAALAVPIVRDGRRMVPQASIGVLFPERDYARPEDLLRDADIAMYEAKGAGKNRNVLFEDGMRHRVQDRSRMVEDLGGAIVAGELRIVYQPIVELRSERIIGCEALARWSSPRFGTVEPSVFVPLAEEAGLIAPLGMYVLREACEAMLRLRARLPRGKGPLVSVNVSSVQLADSDFSDAVLGVLERTSFPGSELLLEITENALMNSGECTVPAIERLRAAGIRFELDDFGTGYSSLAYLHRFPLDAIKIDRSFVRDLTIGSGHDGDRSKVARGLTKGIVTMAHELDLLVVAEGIEDAEQAQILRDYGANLGQGYLFGRPGPAESLVGLQPALESEKPDV